MNGDGRTLAATTPTRVRLFCAAVLCAAASVLFVSPFAHPPAHAVVAVSYVAGSDNRLAAVGLALLGLTTVAVVCWTGLGFAADGSGTGDRSRMPGWMLWSGMAVVAVFTLVLGWLAQRSGNRYGESAYFIERTRDLVDFHLRVYRDLEFSYGPLLLLPAAWLHRALAPLAVSVGTAYFLSLAAMNAAGVAMVAWVLNRLPLTRRWRVLLFGICVAVQMHPLEGANYSLFKFAAPPFLFLWAARRHGAAGRTLAFLAANLLVLLISPELAIGTGAATAAFALLMWMRGVRRAFVLLLTPPAAVSIFLLLFGRGFIDRLAHASAGALNLVPEPMPHLIIFGVAAAWLVPVLAGSRLRERSPDAPLLAGLFVLGLGLLPGALGRCDPLHVFFNGLPLLLLSAVAVQGTRRRWVWAAALVVLAVDVQGVNYRLYGPSLHAILGPPAAAGTLDVNALRAATGGARVATPDLATFPLPVETQLREAGLFQPDFYPGLVEVWDEAGERRKIATLHRSEWMLAPEAFYTEAEPLPNTPVKRFFRLGYQYPQRREPFVVGALLNQDLRTNWTPAGSFGYLILYHRRGNPQP